MTPSLISKLTKKSINKLVCFIENFKIMLLDSKWNLYLLLPFLVILIFYYFWITSIAEVTNIQNIQLDKSIIVSITRKCCYFYTTIESIKVNAILDLLYF